MTLRLLLAPLLACALLLSTPALASGTSVATTWRLLDYIAVDYREAVRDGVVVNPLEYGEMQEFSATAAAAITELPPVAGSEELGTQARVLQAAIADKAAPETIAQMSRDLAALLVTYHPIPLLPTQPPQFERGKALYAPLCASCHGTTGAGDGPASAGLDPPPIDFTDAGRARERSVFGLYQVIDQGLEGTSMVSYASLPEEDRWALATYVGALAFPEEQAERGRQLLQALPPSLAVDLEGYVSRTPAALAQQVGQDNADAIVAYLRRHPDAATQPQEVAPATSLDTARELLEQAMDAYRNGDAKAAKTLALSAYLDGFEPVEPLLAARDKALMVKIEAAMARVRSGIAANTPAGELQVQVDELDALFNNAGQLLVSQQSSGASSFVAAFTILLREGLEALLIVIAIVTLLRKAERRDMLPWVHAGWSSALLAGLVTWGLATWVITISGASRELTEGFGSLLAAMVLVWVGIWMHGKSHADSWQRYVQEKLSHALNRSSGFFLLALVFLVVYREVFETILFYAAIWNQGNKGSVIAGGASAALLLAAVGWAMVRYSRRLPIAQFFRLSSLLVAVLAVVLIGKAISALQEAGYLPITWLEHAPRIELLGIYPTVQGVCAQFVTIVILVLGFLWSNRSARTPHS